MALEDIVGLHINRVRASVLNRHTPADVTRWIVENTTIGGVPFSFVNHEYQEKILNDTSQVIIVRKCSQVGMSEASVRLALCLVNIITPYTIAYTLPTALFASTFMKTRVDPVIYGSRALRNAIHPTNDNSEIKQFGESFLFMKGAATTNAPISIPCDHLIHDEVDFSDPEVLGQYTSRLTHSPWKRVHKFSTPTLPDYGIDKEFRNSRRHFNMLKCNHCNHWFLPDYYKHVRIPGFDGDLREITKGTLTRIAWREAAVHCPSCGGKPDLGIEYREWVCENPDENHVAAGYQVSPFDAPHIITPSYLVEASTRYDRRQDFDNFSLGLPSEDRESTLSLADFEHVFVRGDPPAGAVVMGVDTGQVYHFVVGVVNAYSEMTVIHTECVPMGQARRRYMELRNQFRVSCTVMDSMPHSETVMALQLDDPNLYASVYVVSRSVITHQVIDKEEDKELGKDFQRQVNINRNKAFDGYMETLRQNKIHILDSPNRNMIIDHHLSMKRVRLYEVDGQLKYSWQKTDGVDHFHHAFLYCWIAGKIRGVSRGLVNLPVGSMFSFRVKNKLVA